MKFKIEWIDSGREAQVRPDPRYLNGIDVGVGPCKTELPYPAKRCGYYVVICTECGFVVAVTTAGRPDDPRSVRLQCKQAA